ncbi:MAG TPA: hypothetical protein VMN58_10330 [Acidimicrobiales bacterium]|nr:hypothetical protein [Acidimicrobiales bacterium]
MNKLDEIKLGDIARGLRRYQPFIAVGAVIVMLMVFLPGTPDDGRDIESIDDFASPSTGGSGTGGIGGDSDLGELELDDEGNIIGGSGGGSKGGGGGSTGRGAGGTSGAGSTGTSGGGSEPLQTTGELAANCDPATGRIKVPTNFAPPCMPPFSGDNGGATARGVTADTIKVVYYWEKANPATTAALTAAGAADQRDDTMATRKAYVDYLNAHYNLYGRQVELIVVDATAEATDDAAAKADAIKIATDIQPFLVWGSNSLAFVTEMASRQVLCVCTVSQPNETYEALSPYLGYTTLMGSTQGYVHRSEYICKRVAGRKAQYAGTSDGAPLSINDRKFGLLYYESEDNAYKAGIDYFERELAKCNVKLAARLAFIYPLENVQRQARPFIQKLKSEGVTSVIFSGDPITPAIFTSEATNQAYFPEWIITGSALTDTTIFARTYDKNQWDKAFGISFLTARYPQEQGEAYKVHMWHHGTAPQAGNTYGIIYAEPRTIFTGIHMAGPDLNTISWVRGLFAYPPTGGFLTSPHTSWGDHGIWPFRDYTQYDDVTEIWWDIAATGDDEVGNPGAGMYRYVHDGLRYLPGQHPTEDAAVFDPSRAITFHESRPEGDAPPEYGDRAPQ